MTSSGRAPRFRALRIAGVCFAVFLGLAGLAFVAADSWFRGKYEPALEQQRAELTANVDDYCAQEAALGADPWFHEARTEGNAGPLLNAWLPWPPGHKDVPPGSPLALPEALREDAVDLKQGKWLTANIDVSGLDYGWMARLLAYDRWDLLQDSPLGKGPRINWAAGDMPDYILLTRWAKLRLRNGLVTGHPVEAAQEVRHLAWLSLSTETALGGVIAANLLEFERMAHDSLASPPADWTPMSAEQTDRLSALAVTGLVFSSLASPPDVARKARHCATATSRCLALTEAAFFASMLEPFAKHPFQAAYAALDQDLADLACPTATARGVRARGLNLLDADSGMMTAEQALWIQRAPGHWLTSRIASVVVAMPVGNLQPLRDFHTKYPSTPQAEQAP
ncbi:hypothetical protein OV208_32095 [Corallococcus sp. bb12-1]|uniref:hypothetical protein n=1 Tax=Corallococcus sp. bb12-1 TaxID=2996784 RepID=UPI002271D5D5|nr:hypothetical protein [Corallococcus sp. bb12-1]MCY1045999.1 hypothetical protein [Corallococcus sp. bb12-1]